MKQLTIILFAVITLVSFSSCKKVIGEGPLETENRAVGNFIAISNNITGKVYYKNDTECKVQIIAQRNILDIIETYRNGDELVLKFRNDKTVGKNTDITVNISSPSIERLHVSGSGSMEIPGNIITPQLNTSVSGSGNIKIQSADITNQLIASVSGSGNIRILSGSAKNEDIEVSGSGSIDVSYLPVENSFTEISGSGTARVHATNSLDASISGSGSIYYFGNPIVRSHISGSGRIIPL